MRYIKGKDGKFKGSIGSGKTSVPTPAPSPTPLATPAGSPSAEPVSPLGDTVHRLFGPQARSVVVQTLPTAGHPIVIPVAVYDSDFDEVWNIADHYPSTQAQELQNAAMGPHAIQASNTGVQVYVQ